MGGNSRRDLGARGGGKQIKSMNSARTKSMYDRNSGETLILGLQTKNAISENAQNTR